MIVDCFIFFDEFDILEIRLNSLAPYVDKFVLVEAPVTFRGNPKPLFFNDNKERFSGFNIVYLIADGFSSTNQWEMEIYQRNFIANGIKDVSDDDIIIVSDVDEIPNLEKYDGEREVAFYQKKYYYYLNYCIKGSDWWLGSVAAKKRNVETPQGLRDRRTKMKKYGAICEPGGWHFSAVGNVEQMMHKYDSFSHKETDDEDIRQRIKENREKLRDPWYGVWRHHGRNRRTYLETPTGPQWLLDNRDKYEHLFLREKKLYG